MLLRAAGLSRRVRRGREPASASPRGSARGNASACPAGVIHGYNNDSLEPVYFQVMLGRGKPEAMGYADDELFKRKDAHLKAV